MIIQHHFLIVDVVVVITNNKLATKFIIITDKVIQVENNNK